MLGKVIHRDIRPEILMVKNLDVREHMLVKVRWCPIYTCSPYLIQSLSSLYFIPIARRGGCPIHTSSPYLIHT